MWNKVTVIKAEPTTSKSTRFQCSSCKKIFQCLVYKKDEKTNKNVTYCNYNFCPYCGKKIYKGGDRLV